MMELDYDDLVRLYAGMAMQALIQRPGVDPKSYDDVIEVAFDIAESMMTELRVRAL